MRIYKLLIILLTILSIKTYAQDAKQYRNYSANTTPQDNRTVAERLMQRDTGLVMLGRHRCSGYLVIAAAVERRSHKLYMLDRFGNIWDTVKIRPGDYNAILTKQLNAFDYYVSLQHQSIVLGNELIRQFREYGRLDSLSPLYDSVLQNFPEFRRIDSAAVIQHILKLQREIMRDSLYAWSGNAGTPRNILPSMTYAHDDSYPPGAKFTNGDTIFFINSDRFSPVHKAVLVRKESHIDYFGFDGALIAGFNLKPGTADAIAHTDVFGDYLVLLERSRMLLDKQADVYSMKVVQYASFKQQNQQNLYNAANRLRMLDEKIAFAASPDLKAVVTWLDNAYSFKNDNPYWLAFLGVNGSTTWQTTGSKEYELTNHLGNVMVTITDKRIQHTSNGTTVDYFTPDLSTAQEYYAFGGLMPGRTFTDSAAYRYGFNGKENDNEVMGTGNQIDYGSRIYDPRIGRFTSVDPIFVKYPELSTYQYASNTPIQAVDLDGEERYNYNILFNKDGKAYLSQSTKEDLIDHSIKFTASYPFVTIVKEVNERQEFVIHGTTTRYLDNLGHITALQEEDQKTFSSLTEAQNSVKKNNGLGYTFSLSNQLNQGLLYAAENERNGDGLVSNMVYQSLYEGVPVRSPEPVVVEITMKEGWTPEQQTALRNKIANANKLDPTVVESSISRPSNLRRGFIKSGGQVSTTQDVDHVLDLQLGGTNDFNNLQGLDNSVNRSVGKQIQSQIKNLAPGTKVQLKIASP